MAIEVGFFIGAVILVAAIAWGAVAYGRRNRANEPVTNEAVRAEYADTDSYGTKEPELRSKLER